MLKENRCSDINDKRHLQHQLVEDPESSPCDTGAERPEMKRKRPLYAHFLLAFCQLIMTASYWKESILAMTGKHIHSNDISSVGSNVQILTETAAHNPVIKHDRVDYVDDNDAWIDTRDGMTLGVKSGNGTSVIIAQPVDHTTHSKSLDTPLSSEELSQYNGTSREDKALSYQPFNTTNPHKHSWCPYAKCQNSPLCSPCNRRHLFILATGRSGSTTLLTMLNYLPNIRLSGENLNELYMLSKLETNLYKPNSEVKLIDQNKDVPYGPFRHNGIPAQSMACPIQDVMGTLNPPPVEVQQNAGLNGNPFVEQYDQDMIVGMKTIRYHKRHKSLAQNHGSWSIEESSSFLKNNFPCSKVLVNIRSDVEAQVSSRRWAGNLTRSKIEEDNAYLQTLASELGEDMAKLVDMNNWVGDVSVLNSVVEWLGFKDCNFTSIAHDNHDGYERDEMFQDPFAGSNCHYPY